MIDFKKVRPCTNPYVDGTLDDGRLVEFKLKIPNSMDILMHLIVAMANTNGGIIIFGVDERTMSIVGVMGDYKQQMHEIATGIKKLSVGINYLLIHEVINSKNVITLEIKKSESTSFFSRVETSPARQIAY